MLWDPSKDKPLKTPRQKLIAWLETKPARGEYFWPSAADCMVGRYCRESEKTVLKGYYAGQCGGIPEYFYIARSAPWTFGAALRRAKLVEKLGRCPTAVERLKHFLRLI